MTKMTELEKIVLTECVERLVPPDDATQERWANDPFAMHQEHFRIRPLPPQHGRLLSGANLEWVDEQHFVLRRLGITLDEFDGIFPLLRDGFLAGSEKAKMSAAASGRQIQGAVRNMDTVNCFASFLPRAVPKWRKDLASIGRTIAAMFYLEQMYKAHRSGMDYAALGLKRVDALWRFASFLCD